MRLCEQAEDERAVDYFGNGVLSACDLCMFVFCMCVCMYACVCVK